jgi:hypothetical protein
MEEIDIWRTAALLVKKHGEDADLHAAPHMDAMIARGDPAGEAVWRSIMRAIKVLQTTAPQNGIKLN